MCLFVLVQLDGVAVRITHGSPGPSPAAHDFSLLLTATSPRHLKNANNIARDAMPSSLNIAFCLHHLACFKFDHARIQVQAHRDDQQQRQQPATDVADQTALGC